MISIVFHTTGLVVLCGLLAFQSYNYFFSSGGIKNRYCAHGIHIMSFSVIVLMMAFVGFLLAVNIGGQR